MANVRVDRVNTQFLTGKHQQNILTMLNAKGKHHLDSYFQYILRTEKNLLKYAAVNNKGNVYGFALLKNEPNSRRRKLLLVSAKPGYGSKIMKQIIENGMRNNRNFINLEALNQQKLLAFYKNHGFQYKYKNRNNLHHMEKRLPRMAMAMVKA